MEIEEFIKKFCKSISSFEDLSGRPIIYEDNFLELSRYVYSSNYNVSIENGVLYLKIFTDAAILGVEHLNNRYELTYPIAVGGCRKIRGYLKVYELTEEGMLYLELAA